MPPSDTPGAERSDAPDLSRNRTHDPALRSAALRSEPGVARAAPLLARNTYRRLTSRSLNWISDLMRHVAPIPGVRGTRRSLRRGRRGFTLIEAAMATVIIGVGFTAMLQLIAAGTVTNSASTELTTAMNLAGSVREASMRVGYANLFDLEGEFNPAVDARLEQLDNMPGWTQAVVVSYVDPDLLTVTVPDTQEEPTTRITVTVRRNTRPVYSMCWLMTESPNAEEAIPEP